MKLRHAAPFVALSCLVLAGADGGCSPKLPNGVDDLGGGGDTGGTGDTSDPGSVSAEAIAVGAVVSLHAEMVSAALAASADYDSGSAGRGDFLTPDCVTLTETDAQAPRYELDFTGCSDANGTTYNGGVVLHPPAQGVDGYRLTPMDTFGASNASNDDLHHTYTQGTLTFGFVRDGSGNVTDVVVANFIRHFIRDDPDVTFSYQDVSYSGAIGNHSPWPVHGSLMRIVWNGVGSFDVVFSGVSHADFNLKGRDHRVDLNTGEVSLIQS